MMSTARTVVVAVIGALLIFVPSAFARGGKQQMRSGNKYNTISRMMSRTQSSGAKLGEIDRESARAGRKLESEEQRDEDADDPPVHHPKGYFDPWK